MRGSAAEARDKKRTRYSNVMQYTCRDLYCFLQAKDIEMSMSAEKLPTHKAGPAKTLDRLMVHVLMLLGREVAQVCVHQAERKRNPAGTGRVSSR